MIKKIERKVGMPYNTEAIKLSFEHKELIHEWTDGKVVPLHPDSTAPGDAWYMETSVGTMVVKNGDYIVKELTGGF